MIYKRLKTLKLNQKIGRKYIDYNYQFKPIYKCWVLGFWLEKFIFSLELNIDANIMTYDYDIILKSQLNNKLANS